MAPDEKQNNRQLVAQIKKGSTKAFNQLFELYSQRLYSFGKSMLKNHEDAEGIVQEVFFRIWKKKDELDAKKDFHSLLFSITYNLIIDKFRQRVKEREFEQNLLIQAQQNYMNPLSELEYNELETKVEKAVNELPERRKKIYRLRRDKGLSHKEIAERLSITTKTVENQMNLALKHIREQLGNDALAVTLFIFLFL